MGHAEAMSQFKSGSHTRHRIQYHLVWVPKYRKRVLRGEVANRLYQLFRTCAEVSDWTIKELNIQEDHVHILVQAAPSLSVAAIVQLFKGGSSKIIRGEFPELEEFLWGNSFWADGYFAETVGRQSETYLRKYIREQ